MKHYPPFSPPPLPLFLSLTVIYVRGTGDTGVAGVPSVGSEEKVRIFGKVCQLVKHHLGPDQRVYQVRVT